MAPGNSSRPRGAGTALDYTTPNRNTAFTRDSAPGTVITPASTRRPSSSWSSEPFSRTSRCADGRGRPDRLRRTRARRPRSQARATRSARPALPPPRVGQRAVASDAPARGSTQGGPLGVRRGARPPRSRVGRDGSRPIWRSRALSPAGPANLIWHRGRIPLRRRCDAAEDELAGAPRIASVVAFAFRVDAETATGF